MVNAVRCPMNYARTCTDRDKCNLIWSIKDEVIRTLATLVNNLLCTGNHSSEQILLLLLLISLDTRQPNRYIPKCLETNCHVAFDSKQLTATLQDEPPDVELLGISIFHVEFDSTWNQLVTGKMPQLATQTDTKKPMTTMTMAAGNRIEYRS